MFSELQNQTLNVEPERDTAAFFRFTENVDTHCFVAQNEDEIELQMEPLAGPVSPGERDAGTNSDQEDEEAPNSSPVDISGGSDHSEASGARRTIPSLTALPGASVQRSQFVLDGNEAGHAQLSSTHARPGPAAGTPMLDSSVSEFRSPKRRRLESPQNKADTSVEVDEEAEVSERGKRVIPPPKGKKN